MSFVHSRPLDYERTEHDRGEGTGRRGKLGSAASDCREDAVQGLQPVSPEGRGQRFAGLKLREPRAGSPQAMQEAHGQM